MGSALLPVTSRAAWQGKSIYEILGDRLIRLESLLVTNCVTDAAGRIQFHINTIRQLMQKPSIDDDLVLWSLIEATELSDIYCGLPAISARSFREKFNAITAGPLNPQMETTVSNLARNTVFELHVAGWLSYKGIPTEMCHNPDILCSLADRKLFIQCKRPFSRKNAAANIRRACKQLSLDLNKANDPRNRGVVAISLSHAINPRNMYMSVRTEEHLTPAISSLIRALADHYLLPLIRGPRIVGLVCHVITAAKIEDLNEYRTGQVMALYPSQEASPADRAMLRSVFMR